MYFLLDYICDTLKIKNPYAEEEKTQPREKLLFHGTKKGGEQLGRYNADVF